MLITATAFKNADLDAALALANGGKVRFETAAHAKVADVTLGNPAFAAATGGAAVANATTPDTNAAGGTIDHAHLLKSNGDVLADFTVSLTGAGGDIQLERVVIEAGDTVRLDSITISQA